MQSSVTCWMLKIVQEGNCSDEVDRMLDHPSEDTQRWCQEPICKPRKFPESEEHPNEQHIQWWETEVGVRISWFR